MSFFKPCQNRFRLGRALCFLGLCTSSFPLFGQFAEEPYMVVDDRVELYIGRHLANVRMTEGEIVRGITHKTYRDWLCITYAGTQYDVNSKYFKSRQEILAQQAREIEDLAHEVSVLSDRISELFGEADDLYAAAVAIRFDSTVQYKVPEVRSSSPGFPGSGIGQSQPGLSNPVPGTIQNAPDAFRVVYRFRDRISPSRARNRAKSWLREASELEEKASGLLRKRRSLTEKLARQQVVAAETERRLKTFTARGRDTKATLWVAVKPGAPLFEDRRQVAEARLNSILAGTVSAQYRDWLKVAYEGRYLDTPKSYYCSRSALVQDYAVLAAKKRQAQEEATNAVERYQQRRELIQRTNMTLAYESRLNHYPLPAYPFPSDFRGCRVYIFPSSPANAVEVVNRSRARRLSQDWEGVITELDDAVRRERRRQGEARRDLAEAEARFESLQVRLDAAAGG